MNNNSVTKTALRDNLGYAFGDFGMQAAFGLIASVLQKYYTDVLQIPIASVMLLFILARIWDAVNDPMWGAFVDSRPIHKNGRYRRIIKLFSVPMGISTFLMFLRFRSLTITGSFIYACCTYVLFGMVYTCVNVPYGSLAAVITADDAERTKLSTFRSVGSALGSVPAMILIVLCYTETENGKVMSYSKILIGVAVISVMATVFCLLCQHMVTERVSASPKPKYKAADLKRIILQILKSRAFLSLSIAAMLYLAASVFSQSYYTYLADKYFGMNALSMLALIAQYVPISIVMLFIGKLNKRFGRKELCSAGMLLACIVYFGLYFMHTSNPWFFLSFCLLAGIGNAFLFLQIWALATEVIDSNRVLYGITDDAIGYSLFSFIRKLGHAVAAVFVNASLLKIGYSTDNLSLQTLNGMYDFSVLIPAVLYLTVFVILAFIYPLNKIQLAKIQAAKALPHEK